MAVPFPVRAGLPQSLVACRDSPYERRRSGRNVAGTNDSGRLQREELRETLSSYEPDPLRDLVESVDVGDPGHQAAFWCAACCRQFHGSRSGRRETGRFVGISMTSRP